MIPTLAAVGFILDELYLLERNSELLGALEDERTSNKEFFRGKKEGLQSAQNLVTRFRHVLEKVSETE